MPSQASRRWLEDSGILSCRIKIPLSQQESLRATENQNISETQHAITDNNDNMAGATSMDHPLEMTSPNPRRNNKISETIQSMAKPLDLPLDPDAQATVTDFLDFTEYLPSDMIRSLTLIGNLDQTYGKASAGVHELTKTYGQLPNMSADTKPDPVKLRADISQNLQEAVGARTLAYAEATRMSRNVDRHYKRAKNILAKLQAMVEAYPPDRSLSPVQQKPKSPVTTRAPKITLRVDGSRSATAPDAVKVRKHRAPRITVPGEVLAPYELDYEFYGSEDDWESVDDSPVTPRRIPVQPMGAGIIKLKMQKSKVPKPPRAPRPPGVMGTNVHSAVAGISTSNALAKLKPPPADTQPGSADAPWLELTAWELGKLRKKMKKNAVWRPSDTMVKRELGKLGRGLQAYYAAKAEADSSGQTLEVPPQLKGQSVQSEGAISLEGVAEEANKDGQYVNRGMKLNEAKKAKKELAKIAENDGKKLANIFANLANHPMNHLFAGSSKKTPAVVSKTPATKKRKRDSEVGSTGRETSEKSPEKSNGQPADSGLAKTAKPSKRSKTDTPVPVPPPIKTAIMPTPILSSALSSSSNALISAATETSTGRIGTPIIPPSASSPIKSTTPILPPVSENKRNTRMDTKKEEAKVDVKKEVKKESKKELKKEIKRSEETETAAGSRPRRTSATANPTPEVPARRPTSSRSKAASLEPAQQITATATIDRPRRASTARNTPAPESRQQNKRTKRPAPGVVTTGSEGSAAVIIGKRSGAPRRKAGQKKEKPDSQELQEVYDEIDDEGKIIDPNEERYCFCNRVSFGDMICCENSDSGECPHEWFHFECVGLKDIPPRTTKWYCPDCRVKLKIGEKGEVTARGKKK